MSLVRLRATVVVAAVYGYFLIFAQFSFIELVRSAGVGLAGEKGVLGAMALAGITGGFLAAWREVSPRMIRMALGVAALAAGLATQLNGLTAALGVAVLTGGALGVATVNLAAVLPAWCGVVWVGLGTGLAYAICNLPWVFNQSPSGQAWLAVAFATLGGVAVPSPVEWQIKGSTKVFPAWGTVAIFTVLVWLDSAAFFIIQHVDELKSGTWGTGLLLRNAALHLGCAIVAACWLARGGVRNLPAMAWAILATAALAVNAESTREWSGWLYPAGVSFYSVALVVWPAWFSGMSGPRPAAWRAAWLFAIAGWFGSANGIGMAQSLRTVPPLFVAGAGVLVIGVMTFTDLQRWRSAVGVGVVVLMVSISSREGPRVAGSAVERGRQVYVSEGCIHCHSQYVRKGTLDEENWGPVKSLKDVLDGEPVLIGNRRQGPDLSQVGARRSEAWLKIHFINPRVLVPGSPMPSYAHLFESGKGDDLVRYLKLSGVEEMPRMMERASRWIPEGDGSGVDGRRLFSVHCASCHGANGLGNGPVSLDLVRKPGNLKAGPFVWTPAGDDLGLRVARVVKFGVPGTDMPGHEVLTDSEIQALTKTVLELRGTR